jgi:dihydroorotate dehydrogenase (NAD+) catalytic subunit
MSQRTPLAIELAPRHKTGLHLRTPVMVAAGCYGLGTEYRGVVEVESLGAVVVGPVTMRRRAGAAPPRAVPIPGGVLLHTGLANPGLPTVLRRYGRAWERSPAPVILHLAATSPGEVTAACLRASGVEMVAGVELGLHDGVEPGDAQALVAAAQSALRQPLLVRLPLPNAARLAEVTVAAGADALTVGAPPRGTVFHRDRFVTGRLYGPFVLPLALRALRQAAEAVDVSLVGCGGVGSVEDALAFLQAGASAVQVGAALWQDPSGAIRIATEVATRQADGILL